MSQFSISMAFFLAFAMSAPVLASTSPMSWDQFVAQCQDPKGSKDKQFAPEDIKIECTVVSKDFVEELPGSFELPSAQMITASVLSSKHAVPSDTRSVTAAGRTGECVRYKEVERITRFTAPLTCDAVLNIAHGKKDDKGQSSKKNGSPADYCLAEAKNHKGKDKASEAIRDTGSLRNSCPSDAKYPEKRKDDEKKA
jgi:hypothetical protein